ncbi:MAG: deoxyribodipyrimidine photo-lyase, partial [Bacteroidetes bacterium]|nr:deoxyribodipyrimidine photo-lyase [Bacteroidota bacterium]
MNCFVSMDSIALFWFRRDLRLDDNHGLYRALTSGKRVLLTYIFDLDDWFSQGFNDQRVAFVRHELEQIRQALRAFQSDVAVRVGHTQEELYKLCEQYS